MKIFKTVINLVVFFLLFIACQEPNANEYSVTSPRYTLLDADKNPVPDITRSTTILTCVHKASGQSPGTYYCDHNPVKIIVRAHETIIKEPELIMVSFTLIPPTAYIENEYTPNPNILAVDEIGETKVYLNDEPFVSIPGALLNYSISGEKGKSYTIKFVTVVEGMASSGKVVTGIFE